MKYIEWRDELEYYLGALEKTERDRILAYYSEMYADRRDGGLTEEEAVEQFGTCVHDAADAQNNERRRSNIERIQQDNKPGRQQQYRHNIEAGGHRSVLAGRNQENNLLDAAQEQHEPQHVHQDVHKESGHHHQPKAQQQTAHAGHRKESGAGNVLALMPKIADQRQHAGDEKQHAYRDDQIIDGRIRPNHQQHAQHQSHDAPNREIIIRFHLLLS